MPKIGQHRKLPRNTLTKNIKRGGSCAYKNHIGVYRMQPAYNMTKDKKSHPERMETKKYCRFCKKHTLHKETK